MRQNRHELILSAMCCLQTSIRGAFIGSDLPPPKHIFLTDQPHTPFCLSHSFGYVRHVSSDAENSSQKFTNCPGGKYVETFEVIVGTCSPVPPNVLIAKGKVCDASELYGECPNICDGIDISAPPGVLESCVAPAVNNDGNLDWPDDYNSCYSWTDFSVFLLSQRIILRQNFKNVFCKCFYGCDKNLKSKADFYILRADPWCDGNFQGTRLLLEMKVF